LEKDAGNIKQEIAFPENPTPSVNDKRGSMLNRLSMGMKVKTGEA
jgi:hypothetical protein